MLLLAGLHVVACSHSPIVQCIHLTIKSNCYVYTSLSQALLQAINNAGGREDIIEPAVCALRHITSRHPSADMAQNTVRQVGGIPVVTTFLNQHCRWPLLKVQYCCILCMLCTCTTVCNLTPRYIHSTIVLWPS